MTEGHLKAVLFAVFLFSTAVALCHADSPGDIPHIIQDNDGQISLHLPESMATALKSFDPKFSIRQMSDYPPWWTALYEYDQFYALFAVIGDFKGDYSLDVMLDGDNSEFNRTIALLTNNESIDILIIRERMLPAALEVDSKNGKKATYQSEWDDPGAAFFKAMPDKSDSQTREMVRLINDGFSVFHLR